MKRLLLGGVSLLSVMVALEAGAADLAVKARPKPPAFAPAAAWSGFYIGGNLGGAWAQSNISTGVPCTAPATPPGYFCDAVTGGANAAAIAANGSGTLSASNVTWGAQAGYNWQSGSYVFGLETDINSFHLGASQLVAANYAVSHPPISTGNTYAIGTSFNTDWLFTFRGRAGYLVSPVLLAYVTGGLAVTSLQATNSFADNLGLGAIGSGSFSQSVTGGIVGGGLEWAINAHWSAKAEYLYVKFSSVTANALVTNPTPGGAGYSNAISTSADLTAQIARGGVNYRF